MQIYLPIAELSVNILAVLGLGGLVGFLSGLFGVGGGFLMTPFLIFLGVPAPVAVGTGANQVIASSVSGALAHFRRGNIDIKMGVVLLAGGLLGSLFGIWIFRILLAFGQVDLVVSLLYIIMLGIIGVLMVLESVRTLVRRARNVAVPRKLHQHIWVHGLPWKMRFRRSRLYVSALVPMMIGFFVGVLAAVMGVGGGFIMVPAMIYLLGMPTSVVVGTSLFQIVFVTAGVTFLHAVSTQTVDVVLALLLLVGGVVGAQVGTRFGARLAGEELRALLGIMVLLVALKLLADLVIRPEDLFSISVGRIL